MKGLTRQEVLRKSVVPLVAVTGTGGLAAVVSHAAVTDDSNAEVIFGTVTATSKSSLTIAPDGASPLALPIGRVSGRDAPPWGGNPFRLGERVVLNLEPQGAVVAVEPLSDHVRGIVDQHDGDRLSVAGAAFVVDEWSLARVPNDAGTSSVQVVPLAAITLEPGTEVSLLARRGPHVGARRITAVFVDPGHHNLSAEASRGVGG